MHEFVIRIVSFALLSLLAFWPAPAHSVADPLDAAVAAPDASAPVETLSGVLHRLAIDDRVAGMVVTMFSIEQDDGTAAILKGADLDGIEDRARIEVTGRRNGRSFFVGALRLLAPPSPDPEQKAATLIEAQGKLALLHVDYFTDGRSEFIFELHDAAGRRTELAFHVFPEALQPGMQVVVTGRVGTDRPALQPETVTILALPTQTSLQTDLAKATTTNNVLVILMTFTDSPAVPFSKSEVQGVFSGGPGSGSVAEFFKEASFGQQLINATVTDWLSTNAATPTGCNFDSMGDLGRSAAALAGYNTVNYQNLVYVFPKVNDCTWQGIAYVGANGAWINGKNTTLVFGHELGHNLGLRHTGSLACSGVAVGGMCSVYEYGDLFGIMGNANPMHPNAAQKLSLAWIGTNTVITHYTGNGTYVLNPIETAGGSVYAVTIPAAQNRTYWLEYRQPIGFDAALSGYPNNGLQVRLASPFESLCGTCDATSNDTQLLDMTPATPATFTDAALVVGQSFFDPDHGLNISVVSATASGLTVQVNGPVGGNTTSTVVTSSLNPATFGVSLTFTANVTGSAPTGSVTFMTDGTSIPNCVGVALVTSGNVGTASCTTGGLAAGSRNITARYGGDPVNAISTSPTFVQQVVPIAVATTTTLATSANPALQGATVTLTATVKGSAPTGTVKFSEGVSFVSGCSNVGLVGSGDTRTAVCSTTSLSVGNHSIVADYSGDLWNSVSASAVLSQVVSTSTAGVVWVDDGTPAGAVKVGDFEDWNWISANPTPFSGGLAHQSALVAGLHQHYFYGATNPMPVGATDTLYAYVYLDPANPPTEVMLQWNDGSSWEHRAYWGANSIGWGTDGTAGRRYMGPLPAKGQWVRLSVLAAQVGLDGKSVSGMAFTLLRRPRHVGSRRRRGGNGGLDGELGRRRGARWCGDGRHGRGLELDHRRSGAVLGCAGAPVGAGGRPAPALFLWCLVATGGRGEQHALRLRLSGPGESAVRGDAAVERRQLMGAPRVLGCEQCRLGQRTVPRVGATWARCRRRDNGSSCRSWRRRSASTASR